MSVLALEHAAGGLAAREWDEQHVFLAAAAGQVGGLPVGCFTPRVAPVAAMFCQRWSEHLDASGREAEVRADGLRDALREVLDADALAGFGSLLLRGLLEERR